MKKIALIISLLTLFVAVKAQTEYIDSRLNVVYSQDLLNEMMVHEPVKLAYLNWELDNAYMIMDLGVEKASYLEPLKYNTLQVGSENEVVENIDESLSVNFWLFNVERNQKRAVTYRIANTGKAIAFYSLDKLTEKFNNYNNGN